MWRPCNQQNEEWEIHCKMFAATIFRSFCLYFSSFFFIFWFIFLDSQENPLDFYSSPRFAFNTNTCRRKAGNWGNVRRINYASRCLYTPTNTFNGKHFLFSWNSPTGELSVGEKPITLEWNMDFLLVIGTEIKGCRMITIPFRQIYFFCILFLFLFFAFFPLNSGILLVLL